MVRRLVEEGKKLAKEINMSRPDDAGGYQQSKPTRPDAPDTRRTHTRPPSPPIGKEQARDFITWLLERGEYILTFTVAAVAADLAVQLSRTVKEAIRNKILESKDEPILPVKCIYSEAGVEIILLLDVDFLLAYQNDTGAWDFDAYVAWAVKHYDETVGESKVKAAFFRMTRQEPYWELDSIIDQAGVRIY